MTKTKILTRTILLVSFVSLFTDIASEMLYPVMPIYLKEIGFSVLLIGILEGLAEATAGFSKGYFGNLSDKAGKRLPFVQIGYALSAISKPMMALLIFPAWIFLARTLDRLGKGIRTGARDALLSSETTPEHKGKVFGFHRSMDTVGAAVGPILALLFLAFYPGKYAWLFIIAFIPGLIAIFLTALIKEKRLPVTTVSNKRVSFFSYLGYWKSAGSDYKKLVIGLLAFTLFNSSDALLLLVLKARGLSDVQLIGVYIFYNLVYALFAYPAGVVADKIGLKKVMIIGLSLFVVVYSLISFASSLWFFGILFFIYGIYAASTESISKALITNVCKKEETATAIGFFAGFSSVFSLTASSLGGLLWVVFTPHATFLFSASGAVLVIGYFLIAFWKKKMIGESETERKPKR